MIAQKPQFGFQTMINGTNLDDLSEFRPGLRAAEKYNVRSPLAECGLDKTTVRRLAAFWQLPVWDKPASPCLSSRIAYRNRVTPAKLAKIERAEVILERYGFANCRARLHTDDILRIEVSVDQIAVLSEDRMRRRLLSEMDSLGFSFITLDLQGFHSGSLNQLIDLQSSLLTDAKPKPSS